MFNNAYLNSYFYSETQLIYQGLIVLGIVIMTIDFFTFCIMLKTKYSIFLTLFYCACMLSVIINRNYEPIANIKVIAWMLIQTFVFAAVDRTLSREHHRRHFRYIAESVSFVWFSFSLCSIIMFFMHYQETLPNTETMMGYLRVGFVEGRLFGVFTDPNYASTCVLFTMAMLLSNMFMKKESLPCKIYHIIVLLVDYLYVLLSRSRTSELCLIIVVAVIAFFAAKRLSEKRALPTVAKLAVMVLSAVLVAFGTTVVCNTVNSVADSVYIALKREEGMPKEQEKILEEEVKRPDTQKEDVTNNRLKIWSDYFEVFKQNPIFGTGPRNGLSYAQENMPDSYIVQQKYQYHNGYIAILVGTGIVGSALIMLYIVLVSKKLLLYLWKTSKEKNNNYLPVLMLSSILIIGATSAVPLHILFFNNSALDAIFWFVLGYVMYLICERDVSKESKLVELTDIFRAKMFKSTESN